MASLHHEHIVRINDRINDPSNGASNWLTRKQLWEGLRHTVLVPQVLDESIDLADVQEKSDGVWERRIQRGSAVSVDEVILLEGISLTIRADAAGMFGGSTLLIRIEEPAPEMLFVRFIYRLVGTTPTLPSPGDQGRGLSREIERTDEEDAARRDAYTSADIERIREVRRHAAKRN